NCESQPRSSNGEPNISSRHRRLQHSHRQRAFSKTVAEQQPPSSPDDVQGYSRHSLRASVRGFLQPQARKKPYGKHDDPQYADDLINRSSHTADSTTKTQAVGTTGNWISTSRPGCAFRAKMWPPWTSTARCAIANPISVRTGYPMAALVHSAY